MCTDKSHIDLEKKVVATLEAAIKDAEVRIPEAVLRSVQCAASDITACLTHDLQEEVIRGGQAIFKSIMIAQKRGAAAIEAATKDMDRAAHARGEAVKDAADAAAEEAQTRAGWMSMSFAVLSIFVLMTGTIATGRWSWVLSGLSVFLLGTSVGGVLTMLVHDISARKQGKNAHIARPFQMD
jgi:uncharacterized membrane-anchored protein